MNFGKEEILCQVGHGPEVPVQEREPHFSVRQSGIRMISRVSIFPKPGWKHRH
jgi:hypothetical protein